MVRGEAAAGAQRQTDAEARAEVEARREAKAKTRKEAAVEAKRKAQDALWEKEQQRRLKAKRLEEMKEAHKHQVYTKVSIRQCWSATGKNPIKVRLGRHH